MGRQGLRFCVRFLLGGMLAATFAFSSAQGKIPVSFDIENYFWTTPANKGWTNWLTYIKAEAQFNPNFRFVGSFVDEPQDGGVVDRYLDESYLEYQNRDLVARVGRIRSHFGLSDWSDQYYTPIIYLPILRFMPITTDLSLSRSDSGVDIQGGSPLLQYQVGLVDSSNDSWQFVPKHLDHGSLRLQTNVGDLILGASLFSKIGGQDRDHSQIAGIDVRWTAPQVQIRGEYVRGIGKAPNSDGYYADFYYRPRALYRTQVGVRTQAFRMFGRHTSVLNTVGVRQILNPTFTFLVNYGFGNSVGPAFGMRGWSGELISTIRF